MSFNSPRRAATVIAGLLLCGLTSITALGPLAESASAATSPAITVSSSNLDAVSVNGSGFTPGGQVRVELDAAWGVVSAANVVATEPSSTWACVYGVKPVCHLVTLPGGQFSTFLTVGGCGGSMNGTVKATDLSTGAAASEPTTVNFIC